MDEIIGQTIKEIRPMTQREQDKEGWSRGTTVIVLGNGVLLYASRDEEGNDAGAMFGANNGVTFSLSGR
jgi:hypothetical protein